ncbi:MAG: anthranilate synthase component I [bacterium]
MNKEECYPTCLEFANLSKKANIIPVFKEILADRDTPVSIFEKVIGSNKFGYLLESIEGGERWGRYSFIAVHPAKIIKMYSDRVEIVEGKAKPLVTHTSKPLHVLKELLKKFKPVHLKGLPRFWGGLVGYLGYDIVRSIEELPDQHAQSGSMPDGIFMVTDQLIIFDHVSHKVKVVACVNVQKSMSSKKIYDDAVRKINILIRRILSPKSPVPKRRFTHAHNIISNVSEDQFIRSVKRAKEYIRNGDIIQTVLSQRFSFPLTVKPFEIYRALRVINPSPYLFYLKMEDIHLVGSSPEILVRKEGRIASIRPIAGTRKRGKNLKQDLKLEHELLSDPKELAEHVMLVDLGRNDLGRVCRYNSIKLPELKIIEKYSHVMHIVSSAVGFLKPGKDAVDLLRATFPAGTVTGAPKIRAMEIIDELETCRRGPYAGAVGYFSFAGNMDMCITIRTIVVTGKTAFVQAGAGIVADSIPRKEYIETKNKAAALIAAIQTAEKGVL